MGQYKHRVFVCTSGKNCPGEGARRVHAELTDVWLTDVWLKDV